MKILAFTAFILSAALLTASADGIDGTWISDKQVGDADGKTYAHRSTITLKNTGGVLTGTVVQTSAAPWMRELNGRSIEISDGKVDGDKVSFKLKVESKEGERTSVYEGTVGDDQLKGTVKFRGIGITQPFDPKRAK